MKLSPLNQNKPLTKPFLDSWLDAMIPQSFVNSVFYAKGIQPTAKGLLISFDEFVIFIFKSKDDYEDLLNFALTAVQSNKTLPCLCIQILDDYGSFEINIDEDELVTYLKMGKVIRLGTSTTTMGSAFTSMTLTERLGKFMEKSSNTVTNITSKSSTNHTKKN
jgi:hypothetical protein